ncbi:MAG TPA: hypothetical protein VFW73_12515 [Lacipirellulaceae bacterium]|nr:hypothetical protein [Lacipirellulaceae bacterium]
MSLDETASMFRAANKRGLLKDASSAIFHHLGLMRARIAILRDAFPPTCLHAIAIKANPVVGVLREIVRLGAGLEAASIEEVELALAAGCPPEQIVYDSPAKTSAEIRRSLELGVYLNADNFNELDRIAAAHKLHNSQSIVGLRINTMVGAGAIEYTSVSAASSKFGVPLKADREKILAAFATHPCLAGLHIHVGSQGCSLVQLSEAAARIAELRQEIASRTGRLVSYVDIGGGLPTSYRTGEPAPTPAEYRSLLEHRAPELFRSDVRLVTEFGRAVHANCGIAASRVEYTKPAQRLAVIHLGADFLLRPVYRPENWHHELFVLNASGMPKPGRPEPVTLAGPLCFAGDIIARDVMLPPILPGDWMIIRDVGAYTLSMWSRHCSRAIPAVLGYDPVQCDSLRFLRKAETPNDVVRFWS